MQSDNVNNFIKWYKKLFGDFAGKPPASVWENISEQLDIDEVWTRVSGTLDKKSKVLHFGRAFRNAAAVLVLLLLIGGIGFKIIPGFQQSAIVESDKKIISGQKLSPGVNTSKESSNSNKLEQQPVKKEKSVYQDRIEIKQPTKDQHLQSSAGYHLLDTQANIENNKEKPLEYINDKLNKIEPIEHYTINKFVNINLFDSIYPNNSFLKDVQSFPKGIYAGVTFSMNNIWMFNHETINGFKRTELDYSNVKFGKSYGMIAGYYFSNKWGIQGNWLINSDQGQKYTSYREGI
ncbi:hypothetical protein JYT51_02475, partial [Candidatus Amoebophilus asiaticus]|nr:hypothetical protein [Candidatus Amoebophilus asiaticus]